MQYSVLDRSVFHVYDFLGYRVDDRGFVERPNGSIVSVCIREAVEGHPLYVFSIRHGVVRYPQTVFVHKLVAYQKFGLRAFDPNVVIRHLNGNSLDNSWNNIEIGSQRLNSLDIPLERRIALARHAASFQRSITSDEARLIRETKPPLSEVMARFGVSKSTASYIRSGRTYKD